MPRLLHIDSSTSPHSVSRSLAASFLAVWTEEHPGATVTHRDLTAVPIPHLDPDSYVALMSEPRTDAQRAAAALQSELVSEIQTADALLISVPMHNWTIPSSLKAWLDQSLILGRTLPYDPASNPLAGRPATVLIAYGGDYGPGAPDEDMDHCGPYLRTVLGKVLGYQLELIAAFHTVTPFLSEDPVELEKAALSLRQAHAAAADRARKVAGAPVPLR
ncbi:FMN-dependent NADH-azoreductase [Streptomyces sp. NPDC088261]|uniref:FMN-dependent NADH-azoreductase n=1 Tax=Streptomyces sp. NPDC088261 TaxID=3365851 RepID=UPI00381E5D19